jgi:hypothetical protein
MSPSEIAASLSTSFAPNDNLLLEEAIAKVLRQVGYKEVEASLEASDRAVHVLSHLRRMSAQQLPFDISESRPIRLIGKGRPRVADPPELTVARESFVMIPMVQRVVFEAGDVVFERLCTRMMLEEGASESVRNGSPDDGGIDLYGRIPIRQQSGAVPESLMRTVVIAKELLFLAQCKCYVPSTDIGRPALDEFAGSCAACLNKYDGNSRPPTHRVPQEFYIRNESALKVFFTTASFTSAAVAAAHSSDIELVDGRQIAEFLVARGVASAAAEPPELEAQITTWAGS